ncbi:MAG TPA: hypothetical protein VGG88_04865 [Gaiellaceae bacterium]
MRMLLGALALAASILHTTTRAGHVETLYTSPVHHTIAAFAQDGGLVAWFAPGTKREPCNDVWVWQLGSAGKQSLPAQGAGYHNVTCDWQVPPGSPVGLAVASNEGAPALLWSLHESASQSLKFDYVLGAAVATPLERRFQQVAHARHGAGLWLAGVAGGGTTLVYAVAQVAYRDQLECLSTPKAPGACALKVVDGGIYRVVGRKTPVKIDESSASVAVAVAGDTVAFVPAVGSSTTDGHPLASPNVPVEVLNADTGARVASVSPDGTPVAIALSTGTLALLGRIGGKLVLSWYEMPSGKPAGDLTLPAKAADTVSAGDGAVVFRVGRSIRWVDVATKKVHTVATAAATPIGLSIAGRRVAWAENVGGRGRIRAVTLAP